ncbi:Ldh family oxidoreductase [Roseicitreum antarcticum]|uniref:L-lactate dehydrogenase n=1 Tax=Roseicitreum antarcticum TaxID=564137 RepID=A0A1H2VEV3_9RHOB|nr:Ldh family oxidoreductase [Roseicitreum antarcticum]SDW66885.1 L-lactate dehydrogenase [Roseicitreum antarcticum]
MRYDVSELLAVCTALLQKAGLDHEKALIVAEVLVEGDLMGHDTHGLQLLAPYLAELAAGRMRGTGDITVTGGRGAVASWDGDYLPGPWLVVRAMQEAAAKAREFGMGAIAIARSHHIASLASYLKRAADEDLIVIIQCSDPAVRAVAPHGGLHATHTPNPVAIGYATDAGPVLMDISMSITTNGMSGRLHKTGAQFSGQWLKDADGNATSNPSVLFSDPAGSLLPIGGLEYGHKGFALGTMVEALTSGLSGFGRLTAPDRWGASVLVQMIDPTAFAGLDTFRAETGHFAQACRSNPVPEGAPPVRMPGEHGLAMRLQYLQEGVPLPSGVAEDIANRCAAQAISWTGAV